MVFKQIYQIFIVILVLAFTVLSCKKNEEKFKEKSLIITNDSINIWIKNSKKKSFSLDKRKEFLKKSYQAIKSSKIDTLRVRNLSVIAYQYYKLGDTLVFKELNKEALVIAKKLKDTFTVGDVHWNYASYYNKIQVYDSAYYHFKLAHNNFDKGDYLYESAKTQYGMAFIKGRFKDYTGSEVLTFQVIEKSNKTNNYKLLFTCYNHLGTLQNDIKDYEKALFYYDKAIGYVNKLENPQSLYEAIYNNIANVYVKEKKYTEALKYYNLILANNHLKSQNIDTYARVLDNRAYCRFLMKDTVNVASQLSKALQIRDSIGNKGGVVISRIHLGQYYAFKKDTVSAINYFREAKKLAKEIKNSRDYLESLFLLSELDDNLSSAYLKKYIQFNDSIQTVERNIQNKFTRIAYETDQYIEENKRLSQQKVWISITSLSVVSILSLLYFLKIQKSKNEKLSLENEQQKSNEQLYLTTFKQQEKLEKEKIKERNRISEELHDGVLGKLFGIRVGLGFLDIKGDKSTLQQRQSFLEELKIIEKEIREVSHKLSNNLDSTKINFTTIIIQLLKSKCEIGNYDYKLDFDKNINWQDINEKIKVNFYRIIQEALQNIIKYASAKNVNISFLLSSKDLILIIKDDGIGFNIKKKKKGIGIKNMISRIEKLKGVINIQSLPNEGTTIKIKVPI